MARVRDLRSNQEYKEPSSCVGLFGDPGLSVGDMEDRLEVWTKWWRTRKSAVRVRRGLKARRKVLEGGYDQRVGWLLEGRTVGGAQRPTR